MTTAACGNDGVEQTVDEGVTDVEEGVEDAEQELDEDTEG